MLIEDMVIGRSKLNISPNRDHTNINEKNPYSISVCFFMAKLVVSLNMPYDPFKNLHVSNSCVRLPSRQFPLDNGF
jgi:hypothetical protein